MEPGYFTSFSQEVGAYLFGLSPFGRISLFAFSVALLVIALAAVDNAATRRKWNNRYSSVSSLSLTLVRLFLFAMIFLDAWQMYSIYSGEGGFRIDITIPQSGQVVQSQPLPRVFPPPPPSYSDEEIARFHEAENCHPCTGPQFIQQREFVLIRQPDSHFYAQASIGGMRTNFIIDTGASFVGLPVWMANQIGVRQLTPATSSTANGYTQAWIGVVPEITVEGVTMLNVEAMFYPSLATLPLLGQSVLRQFNIEQRDDRMYFHARSL